MATLLLETAPGQSAVRVIPDGKKFVIGRRKGCDLVIDDSRISRQHAVIAGKAGRYVIKDQNSSNGTAVNGARISEMVELKDGDEIVVGGIPMTFRIDGDPGVPVAAAQAAGVSVEEAARVLKARLVGDIDMPLPSDPPDASRAEEPGGADEGFIEAEEVPDPAEPEAGLAEEEDLAGEDIAAVLAAELGEELEELDIQDASGERTAVGGPAAEPPTIMDELASGDDDGADGGQGAAEEPEGLDEEPGVTAPAEDSVSAGAVIDLGEALEELTDELDDAIEDMASGEGAAEASADDSVAEELAAELDEELEELGDPDGDGDGDAEPEAAESEKPEPGADHPDAGDDSVAAELAEELGEELESLEELPAADAGEESSEEEADGDSGSEEFVSAHGEDEAEPDSDDGIDVFAAVEGTAGLPGAAGAAGAAAAVGAEVAASDSPAVEDLQEAVKSAAGAKANGKKNGKSARKKGTSKRISRRSSQRSSRKDSAVAEAVSGGGSGEGTTIKIVSAVVILFCLLGFGLLVRHNLTRDRSTKRRVVRKENPAVSALREADQLIKQGHVAMRADNPQEAVDCYGRALDHYVQVRQNNPGKGYEYIEEKMTHLNGWLRDAKEKAFIHEQQQLRGN